MVLLTSLTCASLPNTARLRSKLGDAENAMDNVYIELTRSYLPGFSRTTSLIPDSYTVIPSTRFSDQIFGSEKNVEVQITP